MLLRDVLAEFEGVLLGVCLGETTVNSGYESGEKTRVQ